MAAADSSPERKYPVALNCPGCCFFCSDPTPSSIYSPLVTTSLCCSGEFLNIIAYFIPTSTSPLKAPTSPCPHLTGQRIFVMWGEQFPNHISVTGKPFTSLQSTTKCNLSLSLESLPHHFHGAHLDFSPEFAGAPLCTYFITSLQKSSCDADSVQDSQSHERSPSSFSQRHGYLRLRGSHFSCIPVIYNTIYGLPHSVSPMCM